MRLLYNKEVETIERELDMILSIASYMSLDARLRDRANELIEILDSAYHTGVNFELQIINGGKS